MRSGETRKRVGELLAAGYTRKQIAQTLQVDESTVSIHAIRLGYRARMAKPKIYDWTAIRAYYEEGHSTRECRERFGFSSGAWDHAVARGDIVPRPREAIRHSHTTRTAVARLLDDGLTQVEIAAKLALSKSTVAFHVRNLGIPADERFNRRYDWAEVQRAIELEGLERGQCLARFGFSKHAWYCAVKRGDIVPSPHVVPIKELLVVGRRRGRGHVKTRLLREGLKENRCERCGIAKWRGKSLPMQLHHINGDGKDNRLETLSSCAPTATPRRTTGAVAVCAGMELARTRN
jgi:DNA-binding CsgD family transcriptional regulator